MLVDMAERSLSDSPFLDPTTAVQAIDRLHDGLRQLAVRDHTRRTALRRHRPAAVTVPVMDWDAYVHLAFDEIRLAGAQSPQVSRRLTAAWTTSSRSLRRSAVRFCVEQLQLLTDAVGRSGRGRAGHCVRARR